MYIANFAIEGSRDPERPLNHRLSFVLMDGERNASHEMIHSLTKDPTTSHSIQFSSFFTSHDQENREYIFEIDTQMNHVFVIVQRQDFLKHESPALLQLPDILDSKQILTAAVSQALRLLIAESYPSRRPPSQQSSVEANEPNSENRENDASIEKYNRSTDLSDDSADEGNASIGISALSEAYKKAKREGRITGWDGAT